MGYCDVFKMLILGKCTIAYGGYRGGDCDVIAIRTTEEEFLSISAQNHIIFFLKILMFRANENLSPFWKCVASKRR